MDEPQVLDNCTVIEIVTGEFNPEQHNDNVADLLRKFDLKVYQVPAGHHNWICKRCGTICFSEETFFPCRNCFATTRVVCRHGCGSRWRLEIKVQVPTERSLQ